MPGDYEKLRSGEVRWENAVAWTRNKLKDEGFLSSDSPHGVWEISNEGKAYLDKAKKGG